MTFTVTEVLAPSCAIAVATKVPVDFRVALPLVLNVATVRLEERQRTVLSTSPLAEAWNVYLVPAASSSEDLVNMTLVALDLPGSVQNVRKIKRRALTRLRSLLER